MTTCALDGLPLSPAAGAQTALLEQAIESYLAARADTPRILQQIVRDDPEHLMARCVMAYLAMLASDPRFTANAAALQAEMAALVADGAGTPWERAHVMALRLWLNGDLPSLMAHFESTLDQFPRDIVSLRMLHYVYFYHGDDRRMRDSVARRLPTYGPDHPLQGYVKGMLAFGLEEAGDFGQAEHHAREAIAANEGDLWAAHALTHVLQMTGRTDEGVRLVESLRAGWDEANNFRYHLYWHEALFHLARGNLDRVMEIYDDEVGPAVADDFYLDQCNAASLLLRLEALGHDVGTRWQTLAETAERHVADTELVFASLHHLMPLLALANPAAERLTATLNEWPMPAELGTVARDAARFLAAARADQAEKALALFDRCRYGLYRIGGSHAQRELFGIVALNVAERSGMTSWAETFRVERAVAGAFV